MSNAQRKDIDQSVSNLVFCVRRQDWVRAAYWLARAEDGIPETARAALHDQIIGATYRAPDMDVCLQAIDSLPFNVGLGLDSPAIIV